MREAGAHVPVGMRRSPFSESHKPAPVNKGAPAPPGDHPSVNKGAPAPSAERHVGTQQPAQLPTFSSSPLTQFLNIGFAFSPSSAPHLSCPRHETVCTYICPSFWATFPRHARDSHIELQQEFPK